MRGALRPWLRRAFSLLFQPEALLYEVEGAAQAAHRHRRRSAVDQLLRIEVLPEEPPLPPRQGTRVWANFFERERLADDGAPAPVPRASFAASLFRVEPLPRDPLAPATAPLPLARWLLWPEPLPAAPRSPGDD